MPHDTQHERPAESDLRAHHELMRLAAGIDEQEPAEPAAKVRWVAARWAWSMWFWLFLALAIVAVGAGLIVANRGGDGAARPVGGAPAPAQPAAVSEERSGDEASGATSSDAAVVAAPVTVRFDDGNGRVQLFVAAQESGMYNASTVSPLGVTAVVDPAAMTVQGTIELSLSMTQEMRDAPDEYADATLQATFGLPLTAAPPTGGPEVSLPADGSAAWWFGGEVPVAVTMDGQDAASIARWDDGREEVIYEQATEATTVTAWLGGSLRGDGGDGWSVTLNVEYTSPIDVQPAWTVMVWASGSLTAPALQPPQGR